MYIILLKFRPEFDGCTKLYGVAYKVIMDDGTFEETPVPEQAQCPQFQNHY